MPTVVFVAPLLQLPPLFPSDCEAPPTSDSPQLHYAQLSVPLRQPCLEIPALASAAPRYRGPIYIDTIKSHQLPFKLYYHEETLLELRRVIGKVSDRVKGRHWTQALSRAAVQTGMLTGLERKYHELNADSITDPGVYFSKYEHIEETTA